MERHRSHLEPQPHDQQGDTSQQHAGMRKDIPRQKRCDLLELSCAGSPVNQGDAVQEYGGRKRTQDEVLEARLT